MGGRATLSPYTRIVGGVGPHCLPTQGLWGVGPHCLPTQGLWGGRATLSPYTGIVGGMATLSPYTRIVQAGVVQALRCVGAKIRSMNHK